MTQKVLQVGSSAGITISKDALKAIGVKIGDQISVTVDTKRGTLVVLPLRADKSAAEFAAWSKTFISQYGPALKKLAKE